MVATTSFKRAAVLLAAAATQVSAIGSAIIHNQCDFDVYLWAISNVNSDMVTLPANGGSWSQTYVTNPDGGGVSLKMGSDTQCQNITQYEYTYTETGLWYDLSNINGYPFANYGVTVVPSDSSCRGVVCPAGTPKCAAAYNVPDDNFATAECGPDADSVVILCSGETDTSGSLSISSVASVVASTISIPATTPVAAPTTTTASPEHTHTYQPHSWSVPVHHTVAEQVASVAAPAPTQAPVVPEAPVDNPYVVIQTTFVTHVITVEARSPQPTAEVKRDVHHEHAAVHQEHPVKRHQHARAFAKAS